MDNDKELHNQEGKEIKRKPFHKHFFHHVRNAHKRVTKYLYERDTIFATAWVFIFIIGVSFIKINLHFFDPIKHAMHDFDFNDIAFSKIKPPDKFDPRIVIVNIGDADREGIAALIDKTASYNPKVIGLDVYFEGPRDPYKDSVLYECLRRHKNLVTASRIRFEHEGKKEYMIKDYFDDVITKRGFVNLTSEEKGTVRLFSPWEKVNGTLQYGLPALLVKNYDSAAFETLMKRKDHNEVINYTRKFTDHYEPDDLLKGKHYFVVESDVLLNDDADSSYFSGKIAILGYVNSNDNDIEDKKFTPMNEKVAGKQTPDMSGTVVIANIITMMLDHNYINKLPWWIGVLVAVLIGWLHMSFFIHYYLETHLWFHLVAKLAQLLSAILFAYIGMYLFNRYRIKLDMSLTIIVIVLAVDIIYFYEAFAVWMHKKFRYRTVFHQKHH